MNYRVLIKKYRATVKKIINTVNDNIGWELPECVQGAYNVWFNGTDIMVDVETSDGGVSAISYEKFIEFAKKGKVSEDDFCKCFV